MCFTANMFMESFIVSTYHYPLLMSGIRIFFGGILLFFIHQLTNNSSEQYSYKTLSHTAFIKYALSLYGYAACAGSWSMQYIDPVKGCFIFVTLPFITALMLYVWYGQKLTKYKIIGLVLGFIGIVPIILASNAGAFQQVAWEMQMIGYVVYASSVVAFAYGWIMLQEFEKVSSLPAQLVTSIGLILGGVISIIFGVFFYGAELSHLDLTYKFGLWILLFSIVTASGYCLYSVLLQRYSATFLSFASFLEPALALIFSTLCLGNSMSILSGISLGILGIGFYLFYKEELRLK